MLDFLGIGAQKAGTTWLYEMLARHPDIGFPAGKEVHFWDLHRDRGVHWYVGLFAGATEKRRQGEITPAYALLSQGLIRQVYDINPTLRLIYLLRNPMQRAWSSALMALSRAEMTPEEASDQWFLDHFCSAGSLARGDYETCIRNWTRIFPSEQLLLLRHDALRDDPRGLLCACCEHLGLDARIYEEMNPSELARRVFSGPGVGIRPSLREPLRALYEHRILSLQHYLKMDLSGWLTP